MTGWWSGHCRGSSQLSVSVDLSSWAQSSAGNLQVPYWGQDRLRHKSSCRVWIRWAQGTGVSSNLSFAPSFQQGLCSAWGCWTTTWFTFITSELDSSLLPGQFPRHTRWGRGGISGLPGTILVLASKFLHLRKPFRPRWPGQLVGLLSFFWLFNLSSVFSPIWTSSLQPSLVHLNPGSDSASVVLSQLPPIQQLPIFQYFVDLPHWPAFLFLWILNYFVLLPSFRSSS